MNDVLNQQMWRRAFARTLFSFFQAILAQMKEMILDEHQFQGLGLTPTQIKNLRRGSTFWLSEIRKETRNRRLSVPEDLEMAFTWYAYSAYTSCRIDKTDNGWKSVLQSCAIWERVFSPRSVRDFTIEEADLDILRDAQSWLVRSYEALLIHCSDVLLQQVNGLKASFQRGQDTP